MVLGVFVADATFRADRLPAIGETLIGQEFDLGPGGKGSNQSVAAARLGSDVSIIAKLGRDEFARMAFELWNNERIEPLVLTDTAKSTGAACIYVDTSRGNNAIIIVPGAAKHISTNDVEGFREEIESSSIFLTQLETPLEATVRGLEIARRAGVTTILNPAPAIRLDRKILTLCDYLIPNEIETEILTGIKVNSIDDAKTAAKRLVSLGSKANVITLGEKGVYFCTDGVEIHIPPVRIKDVVDTTGAGDCFCGSFAHALLNGISPVEALRFACQVAAISVTRPGAAKSMPTAEEVEDFIKHVG